MEVSSDGIVCDKIRAIDNIMIELRALELDSKVKLSERVKNDFCRIGKIIHPTFFIEKERFKKLNFRKSLTPFND